MGNDGVASSSIQSAITFFVGVLVAGLVGLLFLIIYGNLSGNLGFTDDSTILTNETIVIGFTTGTSTLSVASDTNFIGWDDILILNASIGVATATSNETLVEGVDYTVFSANGTFQNITGNWNRTFVTYTVTTTSQGEADTTNVINNLTSGATQFFTFANVWFILLGVSVLIGIVIGLLVLVMRIRGVVGGGQREEKTRFSS